MNIDSFFMRVILVFAFYLHKLEVNKDQKNSEIVDRQKNRFIDNFITCSNKLDITKRVYSSQFFQKCSEIIISVKSYSYSQDGQMSLSFNVRTFETYSSFVLVYVVTEFSTENVFVFSTVLFNSAKKYFVRSNND